MSGEGCEEKEIHQLSEEDVRSTVRRSGSCRGCLEKGLDEKSTREKRAEEAKVKEKPLCLLPSDDHRRCSTLLLIPSSR